MVFLIYMATTQREMLMKFLEYIKKYPNYKGGKQVMTLIDEWILEGELKGRSEGRSEGISEGELKGKLDIIENMIDAGFDWQLIYQTTGIDSEKYEEMKTKLQHILSMPIIAEQAVSRNLLYSQADNSAI